MSKAINVINEVIAKDILMHLDESFLKSKQLFPDFHGKLRAKQIPDKVWKQ